MLATVHAAADAGFKGKGLGSYLLPRPPISLRFFWVGGEQLLPQKKKLLRGLGLPPPLLPNLKNENVGQQL